MHSLELPRIRATSPTLAETMRACLLRAGLSRTSGVSAFVLGNPKAWLGTAYHAVLEKVVRSDFRHETIDAAVGRLWNEAIAAQQRGAEANPLDRRFGMPTTWPGYFLARASIALHAKNLHLKVTSATAGDSAQAVGTGTDSEIREQAFTAFDGKLVGRPDAIRGDEIVDYKIGAVTEFDEIAETDVVKLAYVRQLRIYGYLVKVRLGYWPLRGVLLPLSGVGVEVALDPTDCENEATDAVRLLEEYNRKISAGSTPEQLASPSPQTCQWCPYKTLCPAFWRAATPDWSGKLDAAAVDGVLVEAPIVIHGGASRAMPLDVQAGSEMRCLTQIAPLNVTIHPGAITLEAGDRIRLLGLRARSDGSLAPTQRTVLARVTDVPTIVLSSQAPT